MKRKNRKPLVTVLMNCYNVEKFIHQAIQSILKQSYKNFELVIVDDASKDKTVKIIKSFKDKRIRLFQNKKNLGLGPSRIKAQKKIKGEYVAIADADDYNSNKRIEKQLKILQNNKKVALVCSWIKYVDLKNHMIGQKKLNLVNNEIRRVLLWQNILPHASIMYKKALAKKVGWYSKKLEYSQDYDLSLKLLRNYECFVIKEFLAFHRVRDDSMTATKKLKKQRIIEHLINLKNAQLLYKKEMNNYILRLNERSIKLNELKLLIVNKKLKSFFLISKKILNIIFQFPEVLILGIKKVILRKNLNIII